MKHRAMYVIAVFLGLIGSLWGAEPFVGTFKLNLAKSKYPSPPKEETVVAVDQGDNYLVTVMGTQADGKPISVKYTIPKNGGPLAFSEGGPPSNVSVMDKKINDYTREDTTMREGKVAVTAHFVASKDGKTLTINRKGTNAQGQPIDRVEVWERQ